MESYNLAELGQTIFEETGDALFLFDPATERIADVNPTARKLSGFSRKELLERKITYVLRSEREGGLGRLREAFQRTGYFHSEEDYLLRTADGGRWIPVNITISRLHLRPQTLGLIAARDVRERHEAHARLQAMEAELRRIAGSISDGLWSAEIDRGGRWSFRYFSPVVETICGRAAENLLGGPERWMATVHADDRASWREMIEQLRDNRACQREYRIVTAGGEVRWVRDSATVSRDSRTQHLRIDGVLTDVSQRRQIEATLQEARQRLQQIVDNSSAVIYVKDLDFRYLLINRQFEQLFYISKEQMVGKTDFDVFPAEMAEAFRRNDRRVAESGEVIEYEEVAPHEDGPHTYISIKFPLRDAAGRVSAVAGISTDISQRKRAEAELQRSNEELAQFAYVASHDLQEPLRAVAGYCRLLQKRHGEELSADAARFVRGASDGAERMQRLIDDLLEYSRVGRRRDPFAPTDCNEVAGQALLNLRSAIDESGAQVRLGALPTLLADRVQLLQLFQNLIGNAIKYRRPDAAPEVDVAAEPTDDAWRFSVCDNGIGIEPQDRERVFVIFQRLHSREQYSGTGIGLAICKRIVERHGGALWVDANRSGGCCFRFTLPHAGGSRAALERPGRPTEEPAAEPA